MHLTKTSSAVAAVLALALVATGSPVPPTSSTADRSPERPTLHLDASQSRNMAKLVNAEPGSGFNRLKARAGMDLFVHKSSPLSARGLMFLVGPRSQRGGGGSSRSASYAASKRRVQDNGRPPRPAYNAGPERRVQHHGKHGRPSQPAYNAPTITASPKHRAQYNGRPPRPAYKAPTTTTYHSRPKHRTFQAVGQYEYPTNNQQSPSERPVSVPMIDAEARMAGPPYGYEDIPGYMGPSAASENRRRAFRGDPPIGHPDNFLPGAPTEHWTT